MHCSRFRIALSGLSMCTVQDLGLLCQGLAPVVCLVLHCSRFRIALSGLSMCTVQDLGLLCQGLVQATHFVVYCSRFGMASDIRSSVLSDMNFSAWLNTWYQVKVNNQVLHIAFTGSLVGVRSNTLCYN